jgi:hypothetical protein
VVKHQMLSLQSDKSLLVKQFDGFSFLARVSCQHAGG